MQLGSSQSDVSKIMINSTLIILWNFFHFNKIIIKENLIITKPFRLTERHRQYIFACIDCFH